MANETTLVVRSDVSGAIAGMRRVSAGAKEMESSMGGFASTIQKNWLGVSAAVAAAAVSMGQAWDLMGQAAAYREQITYLNALGATYGTTGDQIVSDIQKMSDGLISMSDAAEVATQALAKGMSKDQLLTLAQAANTLGDTVGEKASVAFKNLAVAMVDGKEKAAKHYAGIIDLDAKYGDLSKSMTETEKATARYNLIIEYADRITKSMGGAAESTADKMDRFGVVVEDFKLIAGNVLISAAMVVVGTLREWASWALYAAAGTMKLAAASGWLTDKIGLTKNAYTEWNDVANNMIVKAQEYHKEALKDLGSAFSWEDPQGKYPGREPDKKNNAAQDMANKLEQAHKALQSLQNQASLMDPTLSDLDKRFMQLDNQAEQFKETYKDFPELFSQVDSAITQAKGFVVLDMQLKQAKEAAEQFRRAYFARQDFERELTETTMGEIELRLAAEDKWLADMRNKSLEFVQSVEEFNAIDVRLTEATAQKKKEIWDGYFQDLLQKELDLMQKKDDAMKGLTMGAINQGTSGMPGGQDVASLAAIGQGEDPYTKAIEKLNEYYLMRYALAETAAEEEVVLAQWQAEQENVIQQQKMEMASATFGMMAGMAMSFYNASGQQSKAAFTAYKAFAIAQTTIDTIKAAMGAYSAMASILYVGPALGAAAAAAVIAFGMARVAQIAAMQPGTSASVPKPPAHSASASAGKDKATTEATKVEERSQSVNVYIYGNVIDQDKFAREIIPAIAKAQGDRVI